MCISIYLSLSIYIYIYIYIYTRAAEDGHLGSPVLRQFDATSQILHRENRVRTVSRPP